MTEDENPIPDLGEQFFRRMVADREMTEEDVQTVREMLLNSRSDFTDIPRDE